MLCESCRNELNGLCYCNRTVYQMIEQKGGHKIGFTAITSCPRYQHDDPEEKDALRKETAWYVESGKWMNKSKARRA